MLEVNLLSGTFTVKPYCGFQVRPPVRTKPLCRNALIQHTISFQVCTGWNTSHLQVRLQLTEDPAHREAWKKQAGKECLCILNGCMLTVPLGNRAALTTLIPFSPQRTVSWQKASTAALPTYMFSHVNLKRVNWEKDNGVLFFHVFKSIPPTFGSYLLHFFPCSLSLKNAIQQLESQTQAIRSVQLIQWEESSSHFVRMTPRIWWTKEQSRSSSWSQRVASLHAAWIRMSRPTSHATARDFRLS